MKEILLNGNIHDFSIEYGLVDVKDILNNHGYSTEKQYQCAHIF